MHSNKLIFFILKYGLFALGGIVFIIVGARHVFPDMWLFKSTRPMDSLDTSIALLFGLALILIPLTYIDKLVLVKFDKQYITIRKKSGDLKVDWLDIESIKIGSTYAFPVYTLKLKNSERRFVFNTNNNWGRQLWSSDEDSSDMGQFIMTKKKELNI